MAAVFNLIRIILIRLGSGPDLIFFALICLASCNQQDKSSLSVIQKGGKAVAVAVPRGLIISANDAELRQRLELTRKGSSAAILTELVVEDEQVLITPLLPLLPGAEYSVIYAKQLLGYILVPAGGQKFPPSVIATYPSTDTVPENLLKIYLNFSAPMREGEALKHIFLIGEEQDTLPGIFLDLQPELWNSERTVLTLWLDPGRIKRDLIPNQKMGNPLQQGRQYELVIAQGWKSAEGVALNKPFRRKYFVTERDSLGPEPSQWKIIAPKAGSLYPLRMNTGEPLDYFLLEETLTIWHGQTKLAGKIRITGKESVIEFTPETKWERGAYTLRVASALEDLSGNNLNRPFDRDLLTTKEKPHQNYYTVSFVL